MWKRAGAYAAQVTTHIEAPPETWTEAALEADALRVGHRLSGCQVWKRRAWSVRLLCFDNSKFYGLV